MKSRAVTAVLLGAAFFFTACSAGGADRAEPGADVANASQPTLPPDVNILIDAAAASMGEVTSVEFQLDRTGAPIYIDQFESLVLESLVGQFVVPTRAQALLTIKIDGNLTTQLGAIAIDETVWLSNPVTGVFEPLPVGIELDPSQFFNPTDGWQPLLANLTDVELVDGDANSRFHLRGTAGADDVDAITVGLITNQSVPVDLWLNPVTGLVEEAEFTTEFGGELTTWHLELSNYGEAFEIEAPEGAI